MYSRAKAYILGLKTIERNKILQTNSITINCEHYVKLLRKVS